MRYRLITQPTVGPGKVTEELERLLKNAKRLTTSLVVVGPPHKRVPMTATVLEVPDQSAPMAMRVLEVMLGPSGNCEPQKAITARAEWLKHALLVPQKGAQPLVETLFVGWSSACLHVHWRPGRCVGVIHYSEGDAARMAALAAHGWKARVLPANVVDVLATVRLGISWMGRVSHQPFLGKPLVTPTAQSVVAVTSGGKSMTHASLFSGHQESVFQPDSMGGPKHATLGQTRPTGIGTVLAPRGGDGFPLGTTLDGQAVKLAWHALLLTVIAPEDRQRDMVRTLVTRAMEHNLGLIAVIPQSLVSTRQLAAWSARVRVLDPRNMWESHAIPWHMIDPLLLRQALAAAGVDSAPMLPLPTTFGEFLSIVPGGEQYCTESVLALTAPEGDDLRSVVDAGGGVLLLDDASSGGRLLSLLLFALLATNPQIDRRMLLIRSAQIPVPATLAQRSMQVVFGEDPAALGTLRAVSDSWRLTHADGSPATDLDADLDRPSSALDAYSYETLMDTLTGDQTGSQTNALSEALPVSVIAGTASAETWADDADELFTTDRAFEPPFARPGLPVAPTDNHDLFSFDSALDAPAASAPAPIRPASADGSSFRSFFDFPLDGGLDGAAAVPAADWMASSSVADASSAAPPDQRDGESALPDPRETGIGDAFTDFIGTPLDELAALPPLPTADIDTGLGSSDVRNQPADTSDLGFDLFAAPLDFGGIPVIIHDDDAAAFGAASDVLGTGSIFPSFTVDPNVPITPPDLQDWNGELGAARTWASDVSALTTAGPLDEVDTAAGMALAPIGAALRAAVVPEQVSAPTAISEILASARHVHARRRRGWTPSRRVTMALSERPGAGAEEDPAPDALELPDAVLPADDIVLPLDAMTLALTTGDLDLTSAALFEGVDFALPSAAAGATGEPLVNAAALLMVSPLLEPTPGDVLLDSLGDPNVPELLDLAGLNLAVEQVAPPARAAPLASAAADAPDIHQVVEEPGAIMVPIALASMTVPPRAGVDLTFDAAAVRAAWCGGTGMAELVDLVAGQNPGADRSLIRRTIRALLDARAAAGAAGSTLSTTPLWSVRAPSDSAARADTVKALDTAHAPLAPDVPLNMALQSPPTPDLTPDLGGDPGTLETAPAAAPIRDLPAVLPFVVADEQTVQLDMAAAAPDSAVAPASDDDSLSDDAVWARWSNGVELVEISRAISGYTRGRAADQARDRVYRVVVPRIVTALDAEMLITRLIEGRKPLPSQTLLFEELLRQLNRQSGLVTGVIREKTIARLLELMRAARATVGAVA